MQLPSTVYPKLCFVCRTLTKLTS